MQKMSRNFAFIVFFAVLSNAAAGRGWHSYQSHDHNWHHHDNDWYTQGDPSSNDEYDWPDYHHHHHHHGPWGWGDHHSHHTYPNQDQGGNNADFIQGYTPSSSTFDVDTEDPSSFIPSDTFTGSPPSDAIEFTTPTSLDTSSPFAPSPSPPTGSSVDVQTCLRSCLVTSDYQPVCGTDYQTYNNMGRFLCAQGCGVDVRIFLRRTCPSLALGVARSTTVQCIASCPLSEENNPVCGSDDITYDNPSQLFCAQMCGYNVVVKSMTPCSEATSTETPNLFRTPPIPFAVRSCIESCPTSNDVKPVCGTNDVTYQNPSHLECARICGIDVELKQRSPCGQQNNNNNPSIPSVDNQRVRPLPPAVQMCVNACPTTADLRPVCGTNGITYNNPSQLACDVMCGIRVTLLNESPCSANTNNNLVTSTTPTVTSTTLSPAIQACIRSCGQTPEYNPVCGTNGVTYNNPSHLSCAQTCGVSVDIKRRSVCPRPVATAPPTTDQPITPITNGENSGVNLATDPATQNPDVNNGNNGVTDTGVTIPPALILSIFTDATTVKPTVEGDEDVDIDSRYGEDGVRN